MDRILRAMKALGGKAAGRKAPGRQTATHAWRLLPFLVVLASLAALSAGCARNVTGLAREVLRIQIQTKGPIITTNPGIKYYLVLNTTSTLDGPRGYGPWPTDAPRLGWYLPFYLSKDTPTYQGTVPLLSVAFTDVFVLTSVAGTPQVIQQRLVGPNDGNGNPQPPGPGGLFGANNEFIENYRILQQGQDWSVSGNTWNLTLTKADLTAIPDNGAAPISANLFSTNHTAGRGDQIIDRWTLGENDFFTIKTAANSMTLDRNFSAPLIRPENKPSNVSGDSVDFSAYQVEIRSTQ